MKITNRTMGKWLLSSLVFAAPVLALVVMAFAEQSSAAAKLTTPELLELAVAEGELDQETADLYLAYALTEHQKLPRAYQSQQPWSGTLPLLRLHQALPTMKSSAAKMEMERLLAGTCGNADGSFPNVTNSTYFHVEYNTIGGGLSINNYTTSLDAAWATEVESFGWAAPPVLVGNPPPGNLYHVRIDSLGGGLYGYVTNSGAHAGLVGNNPNTTWNDQNAYASCMVLNNDYSGFPGSAQRALDATTAHEFSHSVQFGYGVLAVSNAPDDSVIEGSATWMEDEVFDTANDNYNYLWPQFDICMGEYTASPYPYWITYRGLTERFGAGTAGGSEDVMQDFWEAMSASSGNVMLDALNDALVSKGSNLAAAYHDYAIAVKFNKSCGGGYAYPHCFEEGANYVSAAGATSVHGSINSVGGQYTGSIQDHYTLNWITMPTSGSPYTATLQIPGGGGQLRGSLVCDTGNTLNVTPFSAVVSSGNPSAIVADYNTAGCNSVVAVITNQAQSSANPNSCSAQTYTLQTTGGDVAPTPPVEPADFYLPLIMAAEEDLGDCFIGESENIADSLRVTNGQAVCGQVNSGTNDVYDVYRLFVPNEQLLTITMSGTGSGDADLYLYLPSATDVNTNSPAASSTSSSNDELIQGTTSGGSGDWYIAVKAFDGSVTYLVTAVISNPRTGAVTAVFTIEGQADGSARSHSEK